MIFCFYYIKFYYLAYTPSWNADGFSSLIAFLLVFITMTYNFLYIYIICFNYCTMVKPRPLASFFKLILEPICLSNLKKIPAYPFIRTSPCIRDLRVHSHNLLWFSSSLSSDSLSFIYCLTSHFWYHKIYVFCPSLNCSLVF